MPLFNLVLGLGASLKRMRMLLLSKTPAALKISPGTTENQHHDCLSTGLKDAMALSQAAITGQLLLSIKQIDPHDTKSNTAT